MIDLKQGDCIELMKELPSQSIDLVLCDPPYGQTCCKWDTLLPLEDIWKELIRVCKDNACFLFFAKGLFSAKLILSNEKIFKYEIIWHKSRATNFLNSKRQPLRKHEKIIVFYKKQPTYNPQFTKGKPYIRVKSQQESEVYRPMEEITIENIDGLRYPNDVVYYPTAENEGLQFHPSQKPIALLEYLIKTYSNENDTVLDFTMGSGSTGVACVNTNRSFIGFELDEKYFNIASKRIKNARQ